METTAARYDRLAAAFASKVAAVPRDGWAAPVPCEGWTALDLVRHVATTPALFLSLVDRPAPELPPVEDDPAAAFAASRVAVQAELDDPERAAATFDGAFGRTTLEEAVDRFLCTDLVVHGWDLARGTGQDEAIADGDLDRLEEVVAGFGAALRAPGAFGPPVEPPPGADRQTTLLAFLGRGAGPAGSTQPA